MERRGLAAVLAGAVLVGGAVLALRLTNGPSASSSETPPPPVPTALKAFHLDGVLPPGRSTAPAAVGRVVLTPGPHRLRVAWGSGLAGGHDPAGAVGYELRWGTGGNLVHEKLVANPVAEVDALDAGADTTVRVRAVDAYGQRSAPSAATGRAQGDAVPSADGAFADHFDGNAVPDPALWRLADEGACATAGRGTGENTNRLTLISDCQQGTAALRSRVPFALAAPAASGELGRFTVDTDAPGPDGELDLTLVPGPVDLVGASAGDPLPAAPGVATVDPVLPPGTVRVRVLTGSTAAIGLRQVTANPTVVVVTVGPGTPLVPVSTAPGSVAPPTTPGVSARWDVVLRTDGIRVLRDGVDVGGGNAVPSWTVATALVEFGGAVGAQLQAHVSFVGFGGPRTAVPALVRPPPVFDEGEVVQDPAPGPVARPVPDAVPGSGELRITVVPQESTPTAELTQGGVPPPFYVDVGGQRYAVTPAVPGTPMVPRARYPLVVRLPASVLDGPEAIVRFTVIANDAYQARFTVTALDVERDQGGTSAPVGTEVFQRFALPTPLAKMTGTLLDAGGKPLPADVPVPRGRLELDVRLDPSTGPDLTGVCAGLAGIEVWLDGTRQAAIPTAADGPGIGGEYLVAFTVANTAPGSHTLMLRSFGTDTGRTPGQVFVPFRLP